MNASECVFVKRRNVLEKLLLFVILSHLEARCSEIETHSENSLIFRVSSVSDATSVT